MPRVAKFFGRLYRSILKRLLGDVYKRIEQIEYRSFNRRFYAVEQIADYLVGAQIPGNYLEFGVYRGTTFAHAYHCMAGLFGDMKFYAFDSFQGLPALKGIDVEGGYTSNFREKEFSCSEQEFVENLRNSGVKLDRVITVKGWYDDTLDPVKAKGYGVNKAAVIWIDCDLYESTVPVLQFITPYLSIGTVIVFDDWKCYRNQPTFGEQRACREWLDANPRIALAELLSIGSHGLAFTVVTC